MYRNLLYNEIQAVLGDSTSTQYELSTSEINTIGKIYYPDLSAGKFIFPNSGVFVPGYFAPKEDKIDLIIYFHGLMNVCARKESEQYEKVGVKFILENNPLFEGICSGLVAAKKNAILIVPTIMLDEQKKYNPLLKGRINASTITALIDNLLEQLVKKGVITNNTGVRNIILAGHSAGGSPMQRIIGGVGYKKLPSRVLETVGKIKECWGFDSQYNTDTSSWVNWLKQNGVNLYKHASVGKPLKKYQAAAKFTTTIIKDGKVVKKINIPPWANISNLWVALDNQTTIANIQYQFVPGKTNHCKTVSEFFGTWAKDTVHLATA